MIWEPGSLPTISISIAQDLSDITHETASSQV